MTGFRHAVTLLLTHRLKTLPHDAPPALIAEVLTRLARDVVALADDMRVLPDEADWTTREFSSAVDRVEILFSHRADGNLAHVLEQTRAGTSEILTGVGKEHVPETPRDLFLLYVPEDRLPVAAPLAVELTKRRFTVAFSDYEVDTLDQMLERRKRGLETHRAGLLLNTRSLSRRSWPLPDVTDRFRVAAPGSAEAAVDHLSKWLTAIKKSSKGFAI